MLLNNVKNKPDAIWMSSNRTSRTGADKMKRTGKQIIVFK